MNEKLKKVLNLAIVLLISVTFVKCEQDDASISNQNQSVLAAKEWLKKYEANGDNYALFKDLDYNWIDAEIKKSEDGTETIVVPVKKGADNQLQVYEQKLYIYKAENNNYEALLFEIYPDAENFEVKNTSLDNGEFNGFISVWDLKKGFVRAARFVNDKVIQTGIVQEKTVTKNLTRRADGVPRIDDDPGSTSGGGSDIQLREVIINNNYTKPNGTSLAYSGGGANSVLNGSNTNSYTNHGTGGGGITAPTPLQIIDQLTGKSKCINALLTKNGNNFVQKLLANFQGESKFDIKIVSVDKVFSDETGLEINGKTNYNKNINSKLITIAISTSRSTNQSVLDAARTILHEYIHADIIRKMFNTDDIPATLDFNTAYKEYGGQHGTMAALYLSSMKDALKEFNKTMLPNDYQNYKNYYGEEPSDAFYEALAWSGLEENGVKAWTDLTPQQQKNIKNLANRVSQMSKTPNCP